MIQFIRSRRLPKTKAETDKPVMLHTAKYKTHFLGENLHRNVLRSGKSISVLKRVLMEVSNFHDPQNIYG